MPWEGHPQGAPLPIVFSRRYALGRAPTRGAPTDCLLSAVCPGKGTHKGRPYRLSSLGGMPWEGHPQGVPLPIVFSRRYALKRAPTRGAPTDCLLSAVCPEKSAHKGRPYRLSSLGGMPWEGHPQGAPLPIVFSRRYALGRAPTRGAPTDCLLSAVCPGKGTHKGAPTDCLLSAVCPGKGTHKGRPYRLSSLGGMPWEGHPQGRPYRLSSLGGMPWEGRPRGVPLPDSGSLTWVCPNLMQLPWTPLQSILYQLEMQTGGAIPWVAVTVATAQRRPITQTLFGMLAPCWHFLTWPVCLDHLAFAGLIPTEFWKEKLVQGVAMSGIEG